MTVSGHLLVVRADGALSAAPFDEEALVVTGPPAPVLEGVGVGVFACGAFLIKPGWIEPPLLLT